MRDPVDRNELKPRIGVNNVIMLGIRSLKLADPRYQCVRRIQPGTLLRSDCFPVRQGRRGHLLLRLDYRQLRFALRLSDPWNAIHCALLGVAVVFRAIGYDMVKNRNADVPTIAE